MFGIPSELFGTLFLLILVCVVGLSTLIATGALIDTLQGNYSPIAYTAIAVTSVAVSLGVNLLFGFFHATTIAAVAIPLCTLSLLLLPIRRRQQGFAPLTLRHRIVIVVFTVSGAVSSYVTAADWSVSRYMGMPDAWEYLIQGQVLRFFVDLCIGVSCGVFCLWLMRIRDEVVERKVQKQ